jgi:hypothetical protein
MIEGRNPMPRTEDTPKAPDRSVSGKETAEEALIKELKSWTRREISYAASGVPEEERAEMNP